MPAAADGVGNEEIAGRCGADSDTVRRRRKRFLALGPAGVGTLAKGRGRRPSLSEGTVAEVLRLTREERPVDGSTHWAGDARAKSGRTFAGAEPRFRRAVAPARCTFCYQVRGRQGPRRR